MLIKEALTKYATTNEKKWAQDRSQTVGASEIGQCARKTYFVKNEGDEYFGAHADEDYEDTWGAKVRGSTFEDFFWAPAMRKIFGSRIMYTGGDQKTFKSGVLTATPDGFIQRLTSEEMNALGITERSDGAVYNGGLVLDCKSIDPRVNLAEAKPNHVFQIQCQMGLMREAGFKLSYGVLSYTNASDFADIKEFLIEFNQDVYDVAKSRAENIMFAENAGELQPEGIIAGGKECVYCAFTSACGKLRNSRVPDNKAQDIDPATEQLLIAAAHKRNHLRELAERASLEAAEQDETIKSLMQQAKVRSMKSQGVSISWSAVKGRSGWDNKGVREELEKHVPTWVMESFKTEGDPSDRLTITVAK